MPTHPEYLRLLAQAAVNHDGGGCGPCPVCRHIFGAHTTQGRPYPGGCDHEADDGSRCGCTGQVPLAAEGELNMPETPRTYVYGCDCPDGEESPCEVCDHCESCCGCNTCARTRCGARVESTCSCCDRCGDCCECSTCENCGERLSSDDARTDQDGDGAYCEGCVPDPPPSSRVPFFAGSTPPTFHEALVPFKANKTNPSKRFVSLEIEVAAAHRDRISKTVRALSGAIVEDGSLPSGGFEINTAPAAGDVLVDHLTRIAADLDRSDATTTDKCGLHCHVDARDFSYWDIRRLILLYDRIEPALLRVTTKRSSRGGQPYYYCTPSEGRMTANLLRYRAPKEVKQAVLYATYQGSLKEHRYVVHTALTLPPGAYSTVYYCKTCAQFHGVALCMADGTRIKRAATQSTRMALTPWRKTKDGGGTRYQALNLHAWFYLGTIECRLHHGTVDKDELVNWAVLWAGILDWCLTHTEKDVAGLPADSWAALCIIAPTDAVRAHLATQRRKFAALHTQGSLL